jgi:hypothetical protein
MRDYSANLKPKAFMLLAIPVLVMAYSIVAIVAPAVVRAVVPDVVRTVLDLI